MNMRIGCFLALVAAAPVGAFSDAAARTDSSAGTPQWISGDTKDRAKPAPFLEKTFTLTAVPQKAVLDLAVAGWHEVYVNGVRAGDEVLSPVTCQPDRRLSSVAHDVTKLLKVGENRLAVLLGNGVWNCFTKEVWKFHAAAWIAAPMIRGTLVADGRTLAVTDGSWTAYDSAIRFNALRGGEVYDAREEGRRGNARAAKVETSVPQGAVTPEDAVPCRAGEPLAPKAVFPSDDGATIYDFGSNRSGWCELEVVGEAGAQVTLDYDERLSPTNRTLRGDIQAHIKDSYPNQRDIYTLAGRAAGETWHPRFTYHGFRYVRVATKGRVTVKRLTSVFVRSDFATAGTIATSDPLFTRLYDATRRSYLSNFVGIPTDCPHREKNGWTGDAQLAMETGLWTFRAADSYRHFLRMVLDAQRPNGAVPCILPCNEGFGYGWGTGPAWDAILWEIPWQLYRFTGSDAEARQAWPAMKKYLAFSRAKVGADGLYAYGLGDWCPPDQKRIAELKLTDSAIVWMFHRRAAFWAERFGEADYAAWCRREAAKLREAFNRALYKGDGLYAKGELTELAAPLYFEGLCAEGAEAAVVKRLVEAVRAKGHTCDFGILGAKWVPRVLAQYGYFEDAWQLFVQRQVPGYQAWFDAGEDTLFEMWSLTSGYTSHNHIMFGDVLAWAFEYVAGIVPVEPGFRKIRFAPHAPKGVASFEARYLAPQGEIRAGWRPGTDGKPVFFCDTPKGVEVIR